jgi:hypothetical protein
MNVEKLVAEIIPPNNRTHRENFNNIPILEKLTFAEKIEVENNLTQKLNESADSVDFLIVETLAYLRSEKALPVLYNKLKNDYDNKLTKLIIAVSIFEINMDNNIIGIAINSVKTMDKWDLISAFGSAQLTVSFNNLSPK